MSKQYNIRWKQSDDAELRKAVKNFNAKISRLEKKNPELKSALPERVSVKQMRDLIDTRQDLNREINALKRFTKRGAEEIVEAPDNEYNLKLTKWQKNEMNRRIGVINRKRSKRLKEISEIDMTSRGQELGYTRGQLGMGKVDENQLKPLKAFTPKMNRQALKKKFNTIMRESQSTYWNRKEQQMVNNYLKALTENYSMNDIQDIIDAINDMDFGDFYRMWEAEGKDFETAYPPDREQYQEYLNALRSTWLPNRNPN